MKINLGKKEIIHFIGIGGIGMSGLALIMKQLGFKIQGSDISVNKNIERLKKSKLISRIVIACSDNPKDAPIIRICKKRVNYILLIESELTPFPPLPSLT